MGVIKSVFKALMGPFIVWLFLMAHVVYQVAFRTPDALPKPHWPSDIKEDMKNAMIANRKFIIRDIMDIIGGKGDVEKFSQTRITNDIIWEDPMQKFVGMEEVKSLMHLCTYVQNAEFKVHSEVHSAHEILMDWEIKVWMKVMPNWPMTLPMRTYILLEPADVGGSSEKIFKISEEWYGNVQLNERTVKPSMLGKIHQNYRRFVGATASWAVKKGLL